MIFLGMIVFLTSLASAAVGWYGLGGLLGEIPGGIIGFLCFFLPGIYFMYQNMKAEPEKPTQESVKNGNTATH